MIPHKLSFAGALIAASSLLISGAHADEMTAKQVAPFKMAFDNNVDLLFMLQAADFNRIQVAMGELALRKSQTPRVRAIAQAIIAGRGTAQRDLFPHFKAKTGKTPTRSGPANVAFLNELKMLNGKAFDDAYIGGNISAHEAPIIIYEREIADGKDALVIQHAKNKLPDLLRDTVMLYDGAVKLKAPGVELRPAEAKAVAREMSDK